MYEKGLFLLVFDYVFECLIKKSFFESIEELKAH